MAEFRQLLCTPWLFPRNRQPGPHGRELGSEGLQSSLKESRFAGGRGILQSLFSIPELLKFVEVLVQDVHLRRAHPRHPLTARKHHSGRLKPSLRAPTWATDTHLQGLLSCSLTYWRLGLSCHILLETWTPAGWSSTPH